MLKGCLHFCGAFHLNAVLFQQELGFITANSAKINGLKDVEVARAIQITKGSTELWSNSE